MAGHLRPGSQAQSQRLLPTSRAIDALNRMAQQSAEQARGASVDMQDACQHAAQGNAAIEGVIANMQATAQAGRRKADSISTIHSLVQPEGSRAAA
jgi:methyl-accepting chemotaxis protein